MPDTRPVIACVRAGEAYSADYVRRLVSMVGRHAGGKDYRMVCLTDQTDDVSCETLPLFDGAVGWWSKIGLFRPGVFPRVPVLYLDLDTIICGDIGGMIGFGPREGQVIMLRDFYHKNKFASGIMVWVPGDHTDSIWAEWENSGQPKDDTRGDQGWIERFVDTGPLCLRGLFGGITSWKVDCALTNRPPNNARIVCFHGRPKPHELERLPFIKENWI